MEWKTVIRVILFFQLVHVHCLEWNKVSCKQKIFPLVLKQTNVLGSGCASVGRAVASDTRGPWLKSSHRQKFIYVLNIRFLSTVYWKDENNEKEAHFFKKTVCKWQYIMKQII